MKMDPFNRPLIFPEPETNTKIRTRCNWQAWNVAYGCMVTGGHTIFVRTLTEVGD